AARVIGMGVGPLIGGVLAALVGYRNACLFSMASALTACASVSVLVARDNAQPRTKPEARRSLRDVFGLAFVVMRSPAGVVRLIERSSDPVLPLILAEFDTGPAPATGAALIGSAGLLVTAAAAAGTAVLTRRLAPRVTITAGLLAAAPCLAAIAFATGW